MTKVALSRELLNRLKKLGYKYLLITDVKVICPKNMLYTMTLKPDRVIPACMTFSCTGIDDPLITGALARTADSCPVYVEMPE
ncbi:hypothetical protein [Polluticoccus soli]|uniref:hypothetical protein n=1 Tax=Polluticoccus soli TaxID=3034150 RepID=UPI0023E2D1ED|nr:hypothetical protein [Flavipsychrobacter sp. JY13-12]